MFNEIKCSQCKTTLFGTNKNGRTELIQDLYNINNKNYCKKCKQKKEAKE